MIFKGRLSSSILLLSTLLLGSCSKGLNDSEVETIAGNRSVYIKFINKSKYEDKDLTFHFDPEYSHCNYYSIGSKEGSNFKWELIDYPIDKQNIPFNELIEDTQERNHPHVFFRGSDLYTWHQDMIVSLKGSDQERFQIKGTADANNADEINVWLNRWSNREKQIKLKCSRIEVGKDQSGKWSVYVDIVVQNNK